MTATDAPLADAARRLNAETVVGIVAGVLGAAVLIAAFVTLGAACPGARHGVSHLVAAGCAR